MAGSNGIHSILDEIQAIGEQIQEKVSEKANKLLPDVKEKIYREFGEYQQKEVTRLFKEAVDQFYAAYTPTYYERNRSLYNALEFEPDEYGIVDEQIDNDSLFGSDGLSAFERGGGSGGLFERVFMGGFHGGATGIDWRGEIRTTPSYRTPYGFYYNWGKEAVHTESPHDLANRNIKNSADTFDNEFENISRKHIDVFSVEITKIANEIADELLGDWR